MRSRVALSKFSIFVTLGVCVMLTIALWATAGTYKCLLLALVFGLLLLTAGLYGPLAIEADERQIKLRSFLRSHTIPMSDIASVETMHPTMGAIRILGSGGFMGYWGLFREGDIGTYRAFYGRASDCFLLTLRDGKRYMLGCKDPDAMIAYIKHGRSR